jgi:glycosyltransferase involved in cell wall biosynthesis
MAPHVLIVPTEHYVTERYPLGGIFQYQQAVALHRAGFTVGVIGAGVITPRFLLRSYPYERFERATGIPVYRRYVRRLIPHRWWSASRAIRLYRKLGLDLYARYVREHGRPDVVHAHNIRYAGYIADAIREAHGIPFVITEHSSEWKTGTDAAVIESLKQVAARSARTTGVTQALANWIGQELSTTEIGVLPNIVDSAFLDFPLAPRTIVRGAPRFLSVGLLTENKNHASLIEAFAARFRGSLATLRIGGSGPQRATLERLIAKLDVGGQVTLLGHLSRANVLAEMQAANCFVLSSRYETFGVVLIEAMATGLPVISTRSQGPEELVNDSNGILVDRDDAPALGDAMTRMAERFGDYSPARLREDCRTRFGAEAFVKRAGDLYASAIDLSSKKADPSLRSG